MTHSTTVTLTPDNFPRAKAAILYAISQSMTPTFTWNGEQPGMSKGQTYHFIGLDKDGDLQFKNNNNTLCYASSTNCEQGWFVLNISPEKLAEYSQQQIASAMAELQELRQIFDTGHAFTPGDIIQWKPNMRDRPFPAYNTPVIVLEVISPPLQHCHDVGASAAPAKHDLVIGINMEGVLRHYYADSRRYQPVTK